MDNDAHGQGEYLIRDESITYVGSFNQNHFHGYGKETHKDGTIYQGDYKKGLKCGIGKFQFSD